MHAPPGYVCPFCEVLAGGRRAASQPEDVLFRTPRVAALVSSGWWPNNPGNVLIVPTAHFENLYDLPVEYAADLHVAARRVALAMKVAYGCGGISTRQHNEPDGGQDVWHFHLQVLPRYAGDQLYELTAQRRTTTPEERAPYVARLRAALADHAP